MTTQVRPLSGGAWNNASQDTLHVNKKNTTFGVSLTPAMLAIGLRALNEWTNCAGVGTASVRAQAEAAAAGLQIQEV